MTDDHLKRRIATKVLAQIRRERGEPTWKPTGLFGGGFQMGLQTRARLKRLKARHDREHARRANREPANDQG